MKIVSASFAGPLGLALSVLAPGLGAQSMEVLPVTGPPQAYHLDLETGAITPASAPSADASQVSFSNTTTAGFFSPVPATQLYVDWGVKVAGFTGSVESFDFAYATTSLDPAAGGPGATITVRLFAGTTGFCVGKPGQPGTQLFTRTFKGLPGSPDGVVAPAILMKLTLPLGQPITLADGPIGWGYGFGDGKTGPLLISVGFDATSTVDNLDRYTNPGGNLTCVNTFAFTQPGIASTYLQLTEDDGMPSAKATVRNGVGVNPVDYKPFSLPQLGSNYLSTIDLTAGTGFQTVATVVAIGFGPSAPPPTTIPFPFGPGELLVSLSPFPLLDVANGTHQLPIALKPTLNGVSLFTQGLRAELKPGLLRVVALNAVDLVLGP